MKNRSVENYNANRTNCISRQMVDFTMNDSERIFQCIKCQLSYFLFNLGVSGPK